MTADASEYPAAEKSTEIEPTPDPTVALSHVLKALQGLPVDDVERIIQWVTNKYELTTLLRDARHRGDGNDDTDDVSDDDDESEGEANDSLRSFNSFDQLYEALDPTTDVDKGLAAAYWLGQDCTTTFTGRQIQEQLKPHGHQLGNVTNALSSLGSRKPKLLIQVGKGEGKKGQKKYRLTTEGRKEVLRLLQSENGQ